MFNYHIAIVDNDDTGNYSTKPLWLTNLMNGKMARLPRYELFMGILYAASSMIYNIWRDKIKKKGIQFEITLTNTT